MIWIDKLQIIDRKKRVIGNVMSRAYCRNEFWWCRLLTNQLDKTQMHDQGAASAKTANQCILEPWLR